MRISTVSSALVGLALVALVLGGCVAYTGATPSAVQSTLDSLVTEVSAQSTELARHLEYISHLATVVPRPASAPEALPQASPNVAGSVTINEGACCIGGTAGQPIPMRVAFQAVSTAANVTEMRFRAGLVPLGTGELADRAWGLYVPTTEFEFVAPLGWTTLYASVQFRDADGNVSAVYSDGISVEGFPPPPTSSP